MFPVKSSCVRSGKMTKPTLKFDVPLAPLALQPERNRWRCGQVRCRAANTRIVFMLGHFCDVRATMLT